MILVVSYAKEAGGRDVDGVRLLGLISQLAIGKKALVKIDEANICSICQPDVYLKAPSKKVSHRHLAMHKYIPTSSRKELSKCYVMWSELKREILKSWTRENAEKKTGDKGGWLHLEDNLVWTTESLNSSARAKLSQLI